MKVLFVSYAVPQPVIDDIMKKDSFPPVAAEKLQWNFINGIEKALGEALDLVSTPAISNFTGFPRIFLPGGTWRHRPKNLPDSFSSVLTLPIVKHLWQWAGVLRRVTHWERRTRDHHPRLVITYEAYPPILCAAFIASKIGRLPLIAIVPDLPGGDAVSPANPIKRILKAAMSWVALWCLRRVDGVVALTRSIAEEYAPDIPYIVVEGIIDPPALPATRSINSTAESKIVMYAGLLRKEYGLSLLLEAFELIENDDYQLWIFGRGEDEELVRARAQSDNRIKYYGFVPNEKILEFQKSATVLVNPRPSTGLFTRFSFPSKLLEYMTSGTPVISTCLEGIPEEYYEYITLLKKENPESLARTIVKVCSKPPSARAQMGRLAQEYVFRTKNRAVQGARVVSFLRRIIDEECKNQDALSEKDVNLVGKCH